MIEDDDPGWGLSSRMLVFLLPLAGPILRRRQFNAVDPLVLMRQVFLAFCFALFSFGVVLALIYPGERPLRDPPTALAAGLLFLGAIGLALEPRLERPLLCTNDGTLVGSYRTRLFLRIAFAEACALFGFVGFFLTLEWWPYPLGVALAAVGFRRAAPTRANLRRDQERLAEQGCFRPLVAALRGRGREY